MPSLWNAWKISVRTAPFPSQTRGSGASCSQGEGRKGKRRVQERVMDMYNWEQDLYTNGWRGTFPHKLRIFTCPLKLVGLGRTDAIVTKSPPWKRRLLFPIILRGNSTEAVKTLPGNMKTLWVSQRDVRRMQGVRLPEKVLPSLVKIGALTPVSPKSNVLRQSRWAMWERNCTDQLSLSM